MKSNTDNDSTDNARPFAGALRPLAEVMVARAICESIAGHAGIICDARLASRADEADTPEDEPVPAGVFICIAGRHSCNDLKRLRAFLKDFCNETITGEGSAGMIIDNLDSDGGAE